MAQKKERYRKAIFVVTYKREDNKILYLILKRKLHWKGWEFPKGGIEKGENEAKAIKRELKEETNLKPIKILKYNKKSKYLYDKKTMADRGFIGQTYSLYSAEVKAGKVKIDKKEHSAFRWLNYSKAIKILTWKDQKICLRIANTQIKKLSSL